MQQKSHSLLTVEQPPYIGSLIDGLLSDGNRLEVISVRTPEKALDLIKATSLFRSFVQRMNSENLRLQENNYYKNVSR